MDRSFRKVYHFLTVSSKATKVVLKVSKSDLTINIRIRAHQVHSFDEGFVNVFRHDWLLSLLMSLSFYKMWTATIIRISWFLILKGCYTNLQLDVIRFFGPLLRSLVFLIARKVVHLHCLGVCWYEIGLLLKRNYFSFVPLIFVKASFMEPDQDPLVKKLLRALKRKKLLRSY